jgi:pyruvoyl-dependent arginine decarboxylase (PvlArgDC)
MKTLLVLVFAWTLTACDKTGSTDGTKERATAQEEANKEVENRNLAEKAKKMEAELWRRNRFYVGLANDYTGDFKIKETNFKIKMTFNPTLNLVETDRVRTLQEIQEDINNLFLSAQVLISVPKDQDSFGCIFEQAKVDLNRGVIQLVSNQCGNMYSIKFNDSSEFNRPNIDKVSQSIAHELLEKKRNFVEFLSVDIRSRHTAKTFKVSLKKENGN